MNDLMCTYIYIYIYTYEVFTTGGLSTLSDEMCVWHQNQPTSGAVPWENIRQKTDPKRAVVTIGVWQGERAQPP